jgi:hypothetical protein
MSKLNLIAIVTIIAAVSLIVGMAAPVFAQGNTSMGNSSSMKMGNESNAMGNASMAMSNASNAMGNASMAMANSTK